jgi:uncharacterized OB-fold protein
LKDTATVYTYTNVFVATEQFQDRAPYCSAVLEDEEGERFTAFIIGVTADAPVEVGKKVKFHSLDSNGRRQYVVSA